MSRSIIGVSLTSLCLLILLMLSACQNLRKSNGAITHWTLKRYRAMSATMALTTPLSNPAIAAPQYGNPQILLTNNMKRKKNMNQPMQNQNLP